MSNQDKFTENRLKNSELKYFYGFSNETPLIAKFFKHKTNYADKYIDEIHVFTDSSIQVSEFDIIFLEKDNNGKPGNLIYNVDIKGIASHGRNNTIINISNLKLKYPENDFFVVFEWKVVDKNESQFNCHKGKNTTKRYIFNVIEPTVGAYPSEIDCGWIFGNNGWGKIEKNKLNLLSNYYKKYCVPAINIVTNNYSKN